MYKYIYAVGRMKAYQPGFHVFDISNRLVGDLEKLYSILYMVIEDGLFNNKKVAITLEDYRLEFKLTPGLTIQEWLDTQAQVILKTADVIPGNERKQVKLERLFTNGYFHHPADLNLAKDRQADLLSDSSPDIRLAHYGYKQGIDYKKQAEHALFTCNGVFYRGVGRDDGVYLLGAGNDYIYAKRDIRVGALNFQKVGKLKTIPITDAMVIDVPAGGPARWRLDVTGLDLVNKTIWIVVNGTLLVDPEMLYQVGTDTLVFNPVSFDAMRHFQTYKEYTRTPKLTNMMKMDTYKREALTAHNSFLVIIDNPTVGVEVVPLTTFNYPNVLHTEERFQFPIVLENGLFPVPYTKTYGIKQRLLNHDVRILRKYPIQSSGILAGNNNNAMNVNQGDPGTLPKGFFFKIFGVTFEKV